MSDHDAAAKAAEASFYGRAPYRHAFDIGYPQEAVDAKMHTYRCKHCKRLTTDINGVLANHAEHCEYRRARERQGR